VHALGETKVGDLCDPAPVVVARNQHVAWLEVAMHQPPRVRSSQAPRRLPIERNDRLPRRALFLEPLPEVRPGHVLHRDQHVRRLGSTVLAQLDVVDRDHVGMRQLGHRLCFAYETCCRLVTQRIVMQLLERDLAAQLRVIGPPHRSHAARPNLFQQGVATRDRQARSISVLLGCRTRLRLRYRVMPRLRYELRGDLDRGRGVLAHAVVR